MLATEKIQRAKEYLEQAEQCIKEDNKRLAVGNLDHVKDNVFGAIYLLIAEVIEEEGDY
ncbi:hypothetical protein [Bacillus phage CM1]|nr:hypothetical protein [Bacillus phage vB_BtM_BMBsp2]BEU14757.1 hypothetical protein [Bacillus phage CM1]